MWRYTPPPKLLNILSEQAQSPIPHTSPTSPFTLGQTFILQSSYIFKSDVGTKCRFATLVDAVEFLQHQVFYEMKQMHELNPIST